MVKQSKFKGVCGNLEAKDCFHRLSTKFSFAFMSLLTAPIAKNSRTFTLIYLIFLKLRPRPN